MRDIIRHVNSSSFRDLDWLFRPSSIAVVGASASNGNKTRIFLESIEAMGFQGPVYIVNSKACSVGKYRAYRNISEIPGPVDHVIIGVPATLVREVLQDCALKGAHSVSVYTAGFSETGDAKGQILEEEIRGWMENQSFRLIGPNCLGIYCPESGLGYRPEFSRQAGPIGYVSQSGGMTVTGILLAQQEGLHFSKVVSYGNELDLSSIDILYYLARDPKTTMVWAYIEGTRRGRELLKAMREVTSRKPLLLLKGGTTTSGGHAAASHTGSLAGESQIWDAVSRQISSIAVESIEELVDSSKLILWLPPGNGRRLGLVSISGGLSVNYTDLLVRAGFEVPSLSSELVSRLRKLIDFPGTSMNNPMDLASSFFLTELYEEIFGVLERSKELDALVVVICMEYFARAEALTPGITKHVLEAFVELSKSVKLPFVVVMPPVVNEEMRLEIVRKFQGLRVPVFLSIKRAIRGLVNWASYWKC